MKVRMLVHGSGPDGAVKPGSEVIVSDSHGEELIAGGYAEEVPEPKPVEEESAPEETPEPEADESPEEEDAEPVEDEPAAEETPEPELKKKTTRKRRRTAKSES